MQGWSGGARTSFTVSHSDATPGYLPGPIDDGTWAVALGPVVMHPMGMRWWVRVDLEYGDPPAAAVHRPPPVAVPGRGAGWYRGDLHLHAWVYKIETGNVFAYDVGCGQLVAVAEYRFPPSEAGMRRRTTHAI